MKKLLLTRSPIENTEITERLQNHFEYIHLPLISYQDLHFDYKVLKEYSSCIITSKHSASILEFNDLSNHLEMIVVGQWSSEILRKKGFKIKYIAQNVDDLLSIFSYPEFTTESSIYLSSNKITQDLPVARMVVYNVTYKTHIDVITFEQISAGLDFILLFSQNSAHTLIALFCKYNLLDTLRNVRIFVISEKVAKIMKPYSDHVIYNKEGDHQLVNILLEYAKI